LVNPTYPGVYIVEEPSAVHTITAVATSITAFFGRTRQGPVNKAIRIHSLSDFYKTFGEPFKDSQLGISVQLFFQNGGSDCYIVRLTGAGGDYASIILKNEDKLDVLEFNAKEKGIQGNELTLQVDYDTPLPEDTFNLRIYRIVNDGTIVSSEEFLNCSMDPNSPRFTPNIITQSSDLVDCKSQIANSVYDTKQSYSESRRPISNTGGATAWIGQLREILKDQENVTTTSKIQISVDKKKFYKVDFKDALVDTSINNTTDVENKLNSIIDLALSPSDSGKVEVKVIDGPEDPITTFKTKKLVFQSKNTTVKNIIIKPGSSNDLTKTLMLGIENGGIERTSYGFFRPAQNGIYLQTNSIDDFAGLSQGSLHNITIDSKPIDFGTKLLTSNEHDPLYKDKTGSFDGVREKIGIIASEINSEIGDWNAKVAGSRLIFTKKIPIRNYIPTFSSNSSALSTCFKFNAIVYSLGTPFGNFVGTGKIGYDGGSPTKDDYKGNPNLHTGFYALDLIDLFNIVVIPRDDNLNDADYQDLWADASIYCKVHRALLIIEPPDVWNTKDKALDPNRGIRVLRRGIVKDYSALFFPKLVVPIDGLKVKVNPGGAIAGIMARTDAQVGVWKAPAGLDADIQGGNFDLDILLTDLENGDLNQQGINCLRVFPSGIITWGARTMDGADDFGSSWKYIPIRRLALMIEESLYRGTRWVVFQPNDEPLWAKIRLNVGSFLMQLFRKGAFQGGTPDKAFFVKCDGETTTQADRDLGIVNIIVGFAPLKPAEFVIITIRQIQGDL